MNSNAPTSYIVMGYWPSPYSSNVTCYATFLSLSRLLTNTIKMDIEKVSVHI